MNTLVLLLIAFATNLPLGIWRSKYERFTIAWWLLIHASVPFIIGLRICMKTPSIWVPFIILSAILGQVAGKKIAPKWKKQKEN